MALAGAEVGEDGAEGRAMTVGDILLGTSFDLVRETGGLSPGFRGRDARRGFRGREGDLALDGETTSVTGGGSGRCPAVGGREEEDAIHDLPFET